MVDPQGAQQNYARLAQIRAKGRYGFYEALDFTRSRLPEDERSSPSSAATWPITRA
ncbi:hypothetical protein ACU4GD_37715 [Cupriavidus basilensis]